MNNLKKLITGILAVIVLVLGGYFGINLNPSPANPDPVIVDPGNDPGTETVIAEDGIYTSKEDVALYLHTYGKLPSNFITKNQAEKLGWTGGGLDKYAPDKCIGGGRFGNYEGRLPKGVTYYECDIDTLHKKSRGSKRLVYTKDGTIYYTGDHYETFELLYEGGKP
ncbi:MAG: ribonuclease [Erysipelotrichales bacterium]|nr:ribonuclease [Erysipelotrichales bacterium]MBQ5542669.1 ribonuclease [Erysipelotrichales bacterium]